MNRYEPDQSNPYIVLAHDGVGELVNDVNRHLRTGNWNVVGGVATAKVQVRAAEEKLFYFQAIIAKSGS